jgi:long-chain acyl-CoA synthetase
MESIERVARSEGARGAQTAPRVAGQHRNAVEMFAARVAASGDRTVFRSKVAGPPPKDGGAGGPASGTWRESTWRDWDAASREIAGGLIALGLQPGDRAAILANTRPEWMHADVGVLMAGAVTVPIYQSNLADECQYILADSAAKVAFVENPLQLEKLVAVKRDLPGVVRVVLFDETVRLDKPDAKGRLELRTDDVLPPADRDWVLPLATLRSDGRTWLAAHAGELERRWASVTPDDLFTIVYTSGTTGRPKGVMLTHDNICFTTQAVRGVLPLNEDDEQLLFLPLAHIFAKFLEWVTVERGSRIAFAESIAAVVQNLGEVRPVFLGAVPRVYEKVYAKIQANRNGAPPTKQRIFDWAVSVGRRVSALEQKGRPVPFALELQRRLAHKLVFAKIHAVLGGRIRLLVSGGAPLAREIAEFFHAVGILIVEGYGLTETTAASSINRVERFRFGTVGQAIPGVEVKIADDGEILLRGRTVFRGYFNRPDDTREAIDPEGWFHTGDIGVLEAKDGVDMLRITDRKKDLIVTAGGKNIAPQNLENALKTTPFVSQVMVHGDQRPYLTALVTLNEEAVRGFAKERGLDAAAPIAELSRRPEVRALVGRAVDELNAREPSYSTIKKFEILPQDFSQETGELTPTLKVKRKFTTEKYRAILDGFYSS